MRAWERVAKWARRRKLVAGLAAFSIAATLGLIVGGAWLNVSLRHALDLANRGRYAADMNLARRSFDDGLIYQVRQKLGAYERGDGAGTGADLRGFEWSYLRNLCDHGMIRLSGHRKSVVCAAFHPDGRRLAAGDIEGRIIVWEIGGASRVFDTPGAGIECVAFSPDGRTLAACDTKGAIRLWDLQSGRGRELARHRWGVRTVVFSRDGRRLLAADLGARIVERSVDTGRPLFDYQAEAKDLDPSTKPGLQHSSVVAYSPDGRTIVTGFGERLMVFDAATYRSRGSIYTGRYHSNFAIHPDGRRIVLAGQSATVDVMEIDLADPSRCRGHCSRSRPRGCRSARRGSATWRSPATARRWRSADTRGGSSWSTRATGISSTRSKTRAPRRPRSSR